MKLRKFGYAVIAIVALALGSWSGVASAVPFSTGDVFASVGNGHVEEYSPTGTFIQTLDNGLRSTFTTGGVFDGAGNFYVTTFSSQVVSKFNNNGGLVNGSFMTGCDSNCESITRDASGNAYVGHADGSHAIREYNLATGAFIQSFSGTTGPRGTDWVDLAKDQKTIFYTSEGGLIRRFDTSTNTQLANFNAVDAGSNMFALRILADGGVLVAHSADILRYDSNGVLIKTYAVTGHSGTLFALNLDPDGTSFWTGDLGGDNKIFRVDIATGNIITSFNSLQSGDNTLGGLTVFGEITQGCGDNCGGGTKVPEPATLLLLGSGLIVTIAVRRRARRSASGTRE